MRLPARTTRFPRRRRDGRRGFTFIEILATLTLLTIVLPSVMSGISLSLSAGGLARQEAQASVLAQNKLLDLVNEGEYQHNSLSGDFGTDWPDYRWTAQFSDWGTTSLLRQLDVTVTWRRDGRDRNVVLSTLVSSSSGGETP